MFVKVHSLARIMAEDAVAILCRHPFAIIQFNGSSDDLSSMDLERVYRLATTLIDRKLRKICERN
jgi:hypothetical protein